MEIMIYILGAVIMSMVIVGIMLRRGYKDYASRLFAAKDLPIKDVIDFDKISKIHLYNLKKQEGEINRDDYTYARIARIVNSDLEINAQGGELIFDFPDYSTEANKFKLIDIIGLTTNFNYAQFVFKGQEKFKFFDKPSALTERLKSHALDIADEVMLDIAKQIQEGIDNPSE